MENGAGNGVVPDHRVWWTRLVSNVASRHAFKEQLLLR
jgi:hypothetical protein